MRTDNLQGYGIVDRLGDGVLGTVYRAQESATGRLVALRILTEDIRWDDELRARIRRHSAAVSALNHPNIAQLYAFGEEAGTAFIATELVDGQDLRPVVAERSTTVEKRIALMRQMADGLAHAHEAGILHFDLKPSGILLSSDRTLKIVDFGLTHLFADALPHPTLHWGAPVYLAPEQIRDRHYDARSEIFVAGMIGYELLTGAHPFGDGNGNSLLDGIASDETLPDFDLLQEAPPGLCGILERCLAKDPRDRFESMSDLASACCELLDDIGRECRAMLVELQVAIPRLKRAAARRDAPSDLVTLASRIQTLVGSEQKRDYAALDRLMSALAEQNEVIHSLLREGGRKRERQRAADAEFVDGDPAVAVAAAEVPALEEEFPLLEQLPGLEESPAVEAEPCVSPVLEPVAGESMPPETEEVFLDLDRHELDFLQAVGRDDCEEKSGVAEVESAPPPDEFASPEPETVGTVPYTRHSHSRFAVRPAIWAAATAALVLVAALTWALRSGLLAPAIPVLDRANAVGRHPGAAASPAPAGDVPGAAGLLVHQAAVVAEQGRAGEARLFLNRALELEPDYAPARALREKFDADEAARQSVDGVLRRQISDATALTAAGQLRKARIQIDAIAAAHPDHPALGGLRRSWDAKSAEIAQQAERKKAEQAEVARRASADAVWSRRSGDLFRAGKYAEAQRAAEEWLVESPASVQAESMRVRAAEGRQLIKVIEPAIADRRYPDAAVALARLESINPPDPSAPALRRMLEARKAAARSMLSVYRLGDAGPILFDGVAVGAGEIEGVPVAIGEHTLAVKAGSGPALSLVHDFADGEKAAFVYDGRSLRPITGADSTILANRKIREQVYRIPVEHAHGLLRGSCRGELLVSGAEVRYQPASGAHGFRMPFGRLKLKVDGRAVELRYASDGAGFQSFRARAPADGEALQQAWGRLDAASR